MKQVVSPGDLWTDGYSGEPLSIMILNSGRCMIVEGTTYDVADGQELVSGDQTTYDAEAVARWSRPTKWYSR